jgi:uncharacterized protein YegL
MRRLPVYFLIDVSESMVGWQMQAVEKELINVISELKENPHALDTVFVSVITFAGQAKTLADIRELPEFNAPKFSIGRGTSLNNAIQHLINKINNDTTPTTSKQKGDWKPIIFLCTDGVPTDNCITAINEWKKNWQNKANLIAISVGEETDLNLLKQLTEHIFLLKDISGSSYKKFFKWITATIIASSESININNEAFEIAKTNDAVSKVDIYKINNREILADPNYAIFAAKCRKTKKTYLIKYGVLRSTANAPTYRLEGAFPVDNSYFELSSNIPPDNNVNTDLLKGFPSCPYCGDQWGFSVCVCGRIHCIGTAHKGICPWCDNEGDYEVPDNGLNINRAEG